MLKLLLTCACLMFPPLLCLYLGYTMMVVLWGLILCFMVLMFSKTWMFFVALEFWVFATSEIMNQRGLVPSLPVHFQNINFVIYPEFMFYFILCCMVYYSAKDHIKLRGV